MTWPRMVEEFLDTFKFESEYYLVNCALQWMRNIIFTLVWKDTAQELYLCEYHKACQHTRKLANYYNVKEDDVEE